MVIYLLGVFISAAVWTILCRMRIKGTCIRMPEGFGGNLLDPISKRYLRDSGYNGLLVGLAFVAIFWPVAWGFMIGFLLLAWGSHLVCKVFGFLFGNQRVAKFLFDGK